MIEKFTPEELEQIRKELRERDRCSTKDRLLEEQLSRVISAFGFKGDPEMMSSFSTFDVKNAMTLLVDHALNNYVLNEKKTRAQKRIWKRNAQVPGAIERKYLDVYTRLADVLVGASEPWKKDET